jgi:phage-related protein
VPETTAYSYRDDDGEVPVVDWLRALRRENRKAHAYCVARIRLLAEMEHEMRRPHADYLRDGVYELRTRTGRLNYRVLYFFHGRDVAVLAHGLTKKDAVPDADIERAIQRKKRYEREPERHRHVEELSDG